MRTIVLNRLWIGNALDARDLRGLYDRQIAVVVDLAIEEPPAQPGRDLVYLRIPLIDGAGNSPVVLRAAIGAIVHFIRNDFPLLVACGAGMSRSPAIVAAALAEFRGQPLDDCLAEIVAGGPHDVSPLLLRDVRRALSTEGVAS